MRVSRCDVAHAIIEPTERVIDQRTGTEALRRQLTVTQATLNRAVLQDLDRLREQPCAGRVVGDIQPHLGIDNRLAVQQMPSPAVQRIAGQCFAKQRLGLLRAIQLAEHNRLQITGKEDFSVHAQGGVEMIEGLFPAFLAAVHFRQSQQCRGGGVAAPSGLGKCSVGISISQNAQAWMRLKPNV